MTDDTLRELSALLLAKQRTIMLAIEKPGLLNRVRAAVEASAKRNGGAVELVGGDDERDLLLGIGDDLGPLMKSLTSHMPSGRVFSGRIRDTGGLVSSDRRRVLPWCVVLREWPSDAAQQKEQTQHDHDKPQHEVGASGRGERDPDQGGEQ